MRKLKGNISKVVCLGLFLCACFSAESQVLTVRDQVTHSPIPHVSVVWQIAKRAEVTDNNGQVEIGPLEKDEILLITHPTFESAAYFRGEEQKEELVIYLSEKVIQVDEVVVTANRWEQDRSSVAESVVGISSRDVVFDNPQTSADMLSQTGKVFIQKSQLGGGSPMIRGFAASSVLIVLDGIRMNNAIYRSGNLQNIITLDPNLLEETNVIFGPASTLYGSDALGGVMHFKTLKPRYSSSKKLKVNGSVMSRYSTANQGKTAGVTVRLYNDNISNVTGISANDFNDLRSGSRRPSEHPDFGKRDHYIKRIGDLDHYLENDDTNIQKYSGYSQISGLNKLTYRVAKRAELGHTFYFTTSSDIPRYDRLIRTGSNDILDFAEWYYGPQNLMLNAISYTNYYSNIAFDQAKLTVSNQWVEESRHTRTYQSHTLENNFEEVTVYAANLDFEKGTAEEGSFFYGMEFVANDVESTAYSENLLTGEIGELDTRYPEDGSYYISGAAYASLSQPMSQFFTLDMGLRYTMVELRQKARNVDFDNLSFTRFEQSNKALSGKMGGIFKPHDAVRWNFQISSGFRAPNVDDMGKVDVQNDQVVVPNKDLSPEFTLNYETGIELKPIKNWRIEGTIFYTNWLNAMVRRPLTIRRETTITYEGEELPIVGLVNATTAYIWGYSIGLSGAITNYLGFEAFLNNSMGEDNSDNLPLRHTPPIFGRMSVTYKNNKLRAELYSDFQGKKTLNELAPSELAKLYLYSDEGALAWMTFNAKAAYYFNPQVSVTAAVENILDTHYRPYSSGISAPGINGIVSARYQF